MGLLDDGTPRKEPRAFSKKSKRHILKRQKYKCTVCGKSITMKTSEADHALAYSMGGITDPLNGQGLCKNCHKKKTARLRGGSLF